MLLLARQTVWHRVDGRFRGFQLQLQTNGLQVCWLGGADEPLGDKWAEREAQTRNFRLPTNTLTDRHEEDVQTQQRIQTDKPVTRSIVVTGSYLRTWTQPVCFYLVSLGHDYYDGTESSSGEVEKDKIAAVFFLFATYIFGMLDG